MENNSIREFTCNDCQEVTKVDWSKVRPDIDDGTSNIEIHEKGNGYAYYGECMNCGNLVEIEPPVPELIVDNVDVDKDGMYIQLTDTITNRSCWIEAWQDESGEWEYEFNQYIFHLDNDNDIIAKMFQEDLGNYAEEVFDCVMGAIDDHEEEYNKLQENKAPTMGDRLKESISAKSSNEKIANYLIKTKSIKELEDFLGYDIEGEGLDIKEAILEVLEQMPEEEINEFLQENKAPTMGDRLKEAKAGTVSIKAYGKVYYEFSEEEWNSKSEEEKEATVADTADQATDEEGHTVYEDEVEVITENRKVTEAKNDLEGIKNLIVYEKTQDIFEELYHNKHLDCEYNGSNGVVKITSVDEQTFNIIDKVMVDKLHYSKLSDYVYELKEGPIYRDIKGGFDFKGYSYKVDVKFTLNENDTIVGTVDISEIDVKKENKNLTEIENRKTEGKALPVTKVFATEEELKQYERENHIQTSECHSYKNGYVLIYDPNRPENKKKKSKEVKTEDITSSEFNLHIKPEELSDVNISSLLFDSDTVIADYKEGKYKLMLVVNGDVEIEDMEEDDIYTDYQSFPDELIEQIREDNVDEDRYCINMNNWFEWFLVGGDDDWYDVADIEGMLNKPIPEENETELEVIMKDLFDDIVGQLNEGKKIENKTMKKENVNIEISEDGKEVEVTTDDHEEVEVKDETPDEDNEEKPKDDDTENNESENEEDSIDDISLSESTNNHLSFSEFVDKMRKAYDEDKSLTGVIVFTENSFDKPYSLEARSYRVSNQTSRRLQSGKISNSLFGDCLDGSEEGVRLDWYMGEDGWKVDYCYIENNITESKKVTESKTSDMDTVDIVMELEGGELTIKDVADWKAVKDVAIKLQNAQGFYGRLLRSMEETEDEYGGVENLPFPITM